MHPVIKLVEESIHAMRRDLRIDDKNARQLIRVEVSYGTLMSLMEDRDVWKYVDAFPISTAHPIQFMGVSYYLTKGDYDWRIIGPAKDGARIVANIRAREREVAE